MVQRINVKCGVVQLNVNLNNKQSNLDNALRYIKQCAEDGCQIVCLPEAFSTSVNLPGIKLIAEEIPGSTTQLLCEQAKRYGIYIVAGIIEKSNEKHYSSAVVIDDEGSVIHVYRRIHTYALENRFLDAGDTLKVIDTKHGRLGVIIGYDINFPETCRILFRQNAEIILCPSQLLDTFTNSIRYMAMSRAAENCCYFVFASSTGANTLACLTYMGNSMITRNPVGLSDYSLRYRNEQNLLAETKRDEGVITADLNISKVRREQEENPHYSDSLEVQYGNN